MSKVLCVYLPRWAVQLTRRERRPPRVDAATPDAGSPPSPSPIDAATAVVLTACERGKQWIACACELAEARGVRTGMSLAHAKALLKGTRTWEGPITPAEDARRLGDLARWAQRFSPVVAADEPDGLLLDMAGCERLFGDDEQVVARVDVELRRIGLSARLALAPTVGCAWAAARFAPDRATIVTLDRVRETLAPLPVAGLRVDANFARALAEVGVERIGALFDVPRQELACRFGADLLRRLNQATGETLETIDPLRFSTPPQATRTFDGAVSHWEAIVLTVRELLFSLVVQLEERGCGVRLLEVVLQRISAASQRLSISLTSPSRDLGHLWTLLRPKLEQVHLGYGVESISLRAARVGDLRPRQLQLTSIEGQRDDATDATAWGEFLDRLMDRLGRRAVREMIAEQTHVPEQAFVLREWSGRKKTAAEISRLDDFSAAAALLDRPSQLLVVPEAARVISLVPDGPPSWIAWRGRECAVRCGRGPERIALPWWNTGSGETPSPDLSRDYYELDDDQGRRLWVYRDRTNQGWFVHGLWA